MQSFKYILFLTIIIVFYQNCGAQFDTNSVSKYQDLDTTSESSVTPDNEVKKNKETDVDIVKTPAGTDIVKTPTDNDTGKTTPKPLPNPITNKKCSIDRKKSLLNPSRLIGFGRNTTGGLSVNNFTIVTNLNDDGPGSLRAAMKKNTAWIIFDDKLRNGVIRIKKQLSNKTGNLTIDGRGSDGKMNNITISPDSNSNVGLAFYLTGGNTIIHGVKVDGENKMAGIYARLGQNYWIDHVTVTRSTDEGIGIGKSDAGKASANFTTISNYFVYDSPKGIICGANAKFLDQIDSGVGFCQITVHSSNLSARSRNPRFSMNVQGHVFNNYIHSFSTGGMEIVGGSTVISENNVLSAITAKNGNGSKAQMANNANGKGRKDYPDGNIFTNGDLYLDIAKASGNINPNNIKPFDIPYPYKLISGKDIVEKIVTNAGANNASANLNFCE